MPLPSGPTRYYITIDSAFEGRNAREITLDLPLDGQSAYEIGDRWPTAQAVAQFYAGEFCDSGSVSVRGTNGQRGLVARRQLVG